MRFAVVALLLFLSAVGLGYTYNQGSSAPTFMTAPVERGVIIRYVRANGVIEPVVTVEVSSQLSGQVADVLVSFNDTVTQGQVIARLDPEAYDVRVGEAKAALKVADADALLQKRTIERAEASLHSAETALRAEQAQMNVERARQEERERDYQRFLKLAHSASIADQEVTHGRALRDAGAASLLVLEQQINLKVEAVEIARTEIAMAKAHLANADAVVEQRQAALNQAEVDREHTEIRAPIDGIVILRDVDAGQTIAVAFEAKTLFKIAQDLREMQVRGRIDEADVGKLKVGQNATFTVDAYPDKTFDGKVLQIRKSPETKQDVVTYTAVISAPNPGLLLLPGMTATLRVAVSETAATLKIPNQALRFRPSGAGARIERENANQAASSRTPATIWLVGKDGQPNPVAVRVGVSDDASTALLDGALQEGQQVITGIAHSQDPAGHFGIRLGF